MTDRASLRSAERTRLSRELIVRTAAAEVEEHGLQALTMRSLGRALGVEAMAVYYYVNGREDLLDAIVERLVKDVRVPPEVAIGPRDGWQSYLQALAREIRQLAVDHPQAFPLVATRHPAAPWLRPPLRSLDLAEDFLDAMLRRGLNDDQAIYVYRVFTSFLLGHLLLEVAVAGAALGPVEEPLDEGDPADDPGPGEATLPAHPTIERLEEKLRHYDPEADFDRAVEAMLDRLDIEISQRQ